MFSSNKKQFIFLQGGLGNQLYMIAYAHFLINQGYKNVALISLCTKKETGNTKDKRKRLLFIDIPNKLGIKIYSIHRFIFSFLLRLPKLPLYKTIWSKFINVNIEPNNLWAVFQTSTAYKAFITIHIGYYQAHQYILNEFKQKINQIIEQLSPASSSLPLPSPSDVAIHIRRGDFLTNGNDQIFNKIELPYYLKGLNILSEKINIGKLYIFSDDFEAIKEDIQKINNLYEVILVEGQSVLDDFVLLQQFSNFVIGNSTFAWWAAMLSNAQNVVVPQKPWKITMEAMSPYPPHWTLLQNEPEK